MNFKLAKIIFICIFLFFSQGCFFSTQEKIEKLTDRKFYFSEFQFVLMGQNKESAYNFMLKFPVKKIMFMIANEYNITIDISDYTQFINVKNLDEINTDGSFRVIKHSWKKNKTENNKIVFIFEQDYLDSSKMKFSTVIYNGTSTLKLINTEISQIDSIFKRLQFYLQSGKKSIKEYEDKDYEKNSPIPLIIETDNKPTGNSLPSDII